MNQKKDGVIIIKNKKIRFESEFIDELGIIQLMEESAKEISQYNGKPEEKGEGYPIHCSESSLKRVHEAWKAEKNEKIDFDIFMAAKPSNWIIDVVSTSSYLAMEKFRARVNQALAKMWKGPSHANRRKFTEMFIKPKKIINKK